MKDFTPLATPDTLNETLNKYGVAVLPNVLPADECDALRKSLFDYLANRLNIKEPDDFYKLKPVGEGKGKQIKICLNNRFTLH